MTYHEFKDDIVNHLQERLGPSTEVAIQEIIKNNDTHMDGLTILSKQLNISPTIYLNYYYKQYEHGKSLEAIYDDILKTYEENKPQGNIDISFFTNYDQVKNNIIFKLVNYERNKELLKEIPHYRYLDLAIIFNCLVSSDKTGCATILIHNQHLAYWHITKDDLYSLAQENTPRLLSYELRNMTDVLKEILMQEVTHIVDEKIDDLLPMYVLSNRNKLNGSSCILYSGLLRRFAKMMHSDLYILPSSVHEVLLIPSNLSNSIEELTDMVREVNITQLNNEEILSDHVYYYCLETDSVTM